jgi:hypothetical protein
MAFAPCNPFAVSLSNCCLDLARHDHAIPYAATRSNSHRRTSAGIG